MADDQFASEVREAAVEFVGAVVGGDEHAIQECGNALAAAYRSCVEQVVASGERFWRIPSFKDIVSSPLEAYRDKGIPTAPDFPYWQRECSKHCASALEGIVPALDDVVGDIPFGLDMKLALLQAATGLAAQVKREREALQEKMASRVASAGGGMGLVEKISMRARDMMLARAERAIANGSIRHSDHFAGTVLQILNSEHHGRRPRFPSSDMVNAFILAANHASRFGETADQVDLLRRRMTDLERHVWEPDAPRSRQLIESTKIGVVTDFVDYPPDLGIRR